MTARRKAPFTQAAVRRVIRAARREGVTAATVKMPDGTTIIIPLSTDEPEPKKVERKREVVL